MIRGQKSWRASGNSRVTPEIQVRGSCFEAIRRDIITSRLTIYAKPPTPQTFGFENCVDLFWKLYWEIGCLHHVTPL